LEDINVSIDSWEYPSYLIVSRTKKNLSGYPLTLGRPWLATKDTYIGCREGEMAIENGYSTKKSTLKPHAKPSLDE